VLGYRYQITGRNNWKSFIRKGIINWWVWRDCLWKNTVIRF